jgi:hypothetical protein
LEVAFSSVVFELFPAQKEDLLGQVVDFLGPDPHRANVTTQTHVLTFDLFQEPRLGIGYRHSRCLLGGVVGRDIKY